MSDDPHSYGGDQEPASYYRLGKLDGPIAHRIDLAFAMGDGPATCRQSAIKYMARAGRKDGAEIVQDLTKAIRYLEFWRNFLQHGHPRPATTPETCRRVYLASPYAGDVQRNMGYAQEAMLDSLDRGEAPVVPHLLYVQVLDDELEDDRRQGMTAGASWITPETIDAVVVYEDLGLSEGMRSEIEKAMALGIKIERRIIKGGEP